MSTINALLEFVQTYWKFGLPLLFLLYLLSNRYQKGLHRVPGPWLNSISTFPRLWSVYRGQHHIDDMKLHARYGKAVRLAPNLVSVTEPTEINQLYGITTKFIKSPFYNLSAVYDDEGLVPDPFVIRDNKALHSRMKRNAANAYGLNGLIQFEPWIEPVVSRLTSTLDDYAQQNAICNLGDLLKCFAMDAVCSLTFGSDFGYIEKGDHLGFFNTLDLATKYMSILGHVAWLHPFLLGNPRLASLVMRGDSSAEAMIDVATKELQKFRTSPPAEGDAMTFLSRLALNQTANPKSITDREIITHAFGNISAGSDTTAIALRSTIYNLLKNKKAYSRLCEEVRNNLVEPVRFRSANELPFLKAVIQEAMRLHPSVGQVLGRTVPQEGAVVCGHHVGAGTEVGMSPWVLHRDPKIFPEPEEFKPERWILGEGVHDEEHLRLMGRSFLAFGHGTHTCSGKHISIMEVTKLIPTLILRYELELVDDGASYKFKNWWFTQQSGLMVRFVRR